MPVIDRSITMYVGAVTEIGDGCQVVAFDMPRVNGAFMCLFVPPTDGVGTIYQNDLIEIGLKQNGSVLDMSSWQCYRINEGQWILSNGIVHGHDRRAEEDALVRLVAALRKFQGK